MHVMFCYLNNHKSVSLLILLLLSVKVENVSSYQTESNVLTRASGVTTLNVAFVN